MMDMVYTLLLMFGCVLLTCAEDDFDGTTEPNLKTQSELELFPPKPTYAGQTRIPRTLFKKLHSGAAFLTGLKLGAILSKKGFELGHGKIASSHSFQLFGKSVNSAMSLAYGNPGSLLPLVDDEPSPDDNNRNDLKKGDRKVYRVTVVENPSNESVDGLTSEVVDNGKKREENVLFQDFVTEEPEAELETNLIEEHNKRVKELNDSILRKKNGKF